MADFWGPFWLVFRAAISRDVCGFSRFQVVKATGPLSKIIREEQSMMLSATDGITSGGSSSPLDPAALRVSARTV